MRRFSLKRLRKSRRFLFLLLLVAALPIHVAQAADHPPRITLRPAGQTVSGSPVRLRLHILPAPSRTHPLHLHLYVDGRMVLMRTATAPLLSVTLPALAPGRHEVTVVEADPLTHREEGQMSGMKMEDGGMGGMDMGGMDKMGATPPTPTRKGFLAHLTLVVTGKKP